MTLEDLTAAIKAREEVLKRRNKLNEEIASADVRNSEEFRYAAYHESGMDKVTEMFKERRAVLEVEEQLPTISNVPPELNELFAFSEKLNGNEKGEKIKSLLDADYTLESTKFRLGLTALHVAVAKSDVDLVKILLSRGSSTEAKDYKGKRPADYTREATVLKVRGSELRS